MDRLRVVTIPTDGRRPTTVVDLADGTLLAPVRDSFAVTPPASQSVVAKQVGRWGGASPVSDSFDNGAIAVRLFARGAATADDTLALVSNLLSKIDPITAALFLEWRPDGASRSVFYEIRGEPSWDYGYSWVVFQSTRSLEVGLNFPVAPLARGPMMDVWEDWAVDSVAAADWTVDSGGGTFTVDTANNQLVPTSTASKQLRHTVRGYTVADVQVTSQFTTGASVAGQIHRVIARATSAGDYLIGVVDSGNLSIHSLVGGVTDTVLATTAFAGLAVNTRYWLRFRTEGPYATAELFTFPPAVAVTPTAAITYTLPSGNPFAAGVAGGFGVRLTPNATDVRYGHVTIEPYTFRTNMPQTPDGLDLLGVPGDAPALTDVIVENPGSLSAAVWAAIIGWRRTPATYNSVWNGLFEHDNAGWSVASVANITPGGAATSIVASSAGTPKFGYGFGRITTPATQFVGASFRVFKNFRKNVTYTAEIWVRSTTATTGVGLKLGNSAANDVATSANLVLTAGWQKMTLQWTPTADRTDAHIGIISNTATAIVFDIDGASVYEGTTAPTLASQIEGRGAVPPFGRVYGAGLTLQDSTMTISGTAAQATLSGAGSWIGAWWVDPGLLDPDDFAERAQIEVWGQLTIPTTAVQPRVVLSSRATTEGLTASTDSYSAEYGAAGKALPVPTGGGSQPILVRLGTLTLPIYRNRRVSPHEVRLTTSVGAGSTGTFQVNEIIMVPALSRVASPTGKVADSTYPQFFTNNSAEVKRVLSDGSARSGSGATGSDEHASTALGGAPLEVLPGNVRFVLRQTSNVPDDPAPANSVAGTHNDGYAVPTLATRFSVTPRYRLVRGS